ncbi:hypothetical protein P12x_000918 [Tundrisphaera lichenicola]|uniref:hypothetical protein n=1 Tax=Tundrisphaera lichenicola TaxID=2029860 RepID=UPI003EBB8B91
MAESQAPEKSDGKSSRPADRGVLAFRIASPPQASKIQYAGRSAAQGVAAAYHFADASRRDAGRE